LGAAAAGDSPPGAPAPFPGGLSLAAAAGRRGEKAEPPPRPPPAHLLHQLDCEATPTGALATGTCRLQASPTWACWADKADAGTPTSPSQGSAAVEDKQEQLVQQTRGAKVKKTALHADEVEDIKTFVSELASASSKRVFVSEYKNRGLAARIVRSNYFEPTFLFLICLNLFWMAIDTDFACDGCSMEGHLGFIIVDNLFCGIFLGEVVVQFLAYRKKHYALCEPWFVFNCLLVAQNCFETWFMPLVESLSSYEKGSGLDFGNLRIVRLLRLTRIFRLVRLIKAVPELVYLFQGLRTSFRSVFFTFLLLTLVLFVAGITERQLSLGTDTIEEKYFPSVPEAMLMLTFHGALLDEAGEMMSELRSEVPSCSVVFGIVILLSAITMMNLLIGVLCEVMFTVAKTEKKKDVEANFRSTIDTILDEFHNDTDGDGLISVEEFRHIMRHERTFKALREVDVDPIALLSLADSIFQSDEQGQQFRTKLNREEFMEWVMKLRDHNQASKRDVVHLRQYIHAENTDRNIILAHAERERMWMYERGEVERNLMAQKIDTLGKHIAALVEDRRPMSSQSTKEPGPPYRCDENEV
jgi:hypothetical protein